MPLLDRKVGGQRVCSGAVWCAPDSAFLQYVLERRPPPFKGLCNGDYEGIVLLDELRLADLRTHYPVPKLSLRDAYRLGPLLLCWGPFLVLLQPIPFPHQSAIVPDNLCQLVCRPPTVAVSVQR